jgi:dTMP kinase
MTKGKFIVFEGIDGSGKSTICKMLKDLLTESYPEQKVHFTTEPTNGPAGKLIREYLHGETHFLSTDENIQIEHDSEFIGRLVSADRYYHAHNDEDGIFELLDLGVTVITDRYNYSTFAYNSPINEYTKMLHVDGLPIPDIVFYLDISPADAIERLGARRDLDAHENIEKLTDAHQRYEQMLQSGFMKAHVIDATLPSEEVLNKILSYLKGYHYAIS